MKIATHNSATGEAGHGLISWLITPFARCQSKTIAEQLKCGCQLFDIRVRMTDRGWVCAHGLWESECNVEDILSELNAYSDVYVNITYEGKGIPAFTLVVEEWRRTFRRITFCVISIKKPKWQVIKVYNILPSYRDGYMRLDWSSWHTLIPIPWVWKKLYHDKPVFSDDYFLTVDFL